MWRERFILIISRARECVRSIWLLLSERVRKVAADAHLFAKKVLPIAFLAVSATAFVVSGVLTVLGFRDWKSVSAGLVGIFSTIITAYLWWEALISSVARMKMWLRYTWTLHSTQVRKFAAELRAKGMQLFYMLKSSVRKFIKKAFSDIPLAVSVIALVVGSFLMFEGYGDWRSIAVGLVAILGTLCATYSYRLKKRQETAVMALTTKYLLTREASNLDDILGVLINGTGYWNRINPSEEFFAALESVCRANQYEIKRRLAEALPALFKLDMERTKGLVRILRTDWDVEHWKGDNRRRTVESIAFIVDQDMGFVMETVQLMAGDEIYTIIAAVEVLYECRRYYRKHADICFESMIEDVRKIFQPEETAAVEHLWRFLPMTHHDKSGALRECKNMVDHSNPYVQICAARNLRRLCTGYPRCRQESACRGKPIDILALKNRILEKIDNENARRPIAKEDSLDCLIAILRSPYASQAREIILKLHNDTDRIIRVTAFDRIERIWEQDQHFAEQIIQQVLDRTDDCELVERASRVKRTLS